MAYWEYNISVYGMYIGIGVPVLSVSDASRKRQSIGIVRYRIGEGVGGGLFSEQQETEEKLPGPHRSLERERGKRRTCSFTSRL